MSSLGSQMNTFWSCSQIMKHVCECVFHQLCCNDCSKSVKCMTHWSCDAQDRICAPVTKDLWTHSTYFVFTMVEKIFTTSNLLLHMWLYSLCLNIGCKKLPDQQSKEPSCETLMAQLQLWQALLEGTPAPNPRPADPVLPWWDRKRPKRGKGTRRSDWLRSQLSHWMKPPKAPTLRPLPRGGSVEALVVNLQRTHLDHEEWPTLGYIGSTVAIELEKS